MHHISEQIPYTLYHIIENLQTVYHVIKNFRIVYADEGLAFEGSLVQKQNQHFTLSASKYPSTKINTILRFNRHPNTLCCTVL